MRCDIGTNFPHGVRLHQLRIKRMQENSRKLQENSRKLQENSRKLQDLGVENASDAFKVKKAATKPKKEDAAEGRRSSRVAALPACNYQDKDVLEGLRGSRRCASSDPRIFVGRNMPHALCNEVVNAAKVVESSFQSGNPSLMRVMMPSHVSSCFWMGLPRGFCVEHMPKEDADMILLDEDGGEWQSRYLAHKTGLSGGWRGFALDHNLECGDVVIFELIAPLTIQIHIFRVADYESGGGAVVSEKPNGKQTKRETGSIPVQGRTKRFKAKEIDIEDDGEICQDKQRKLRSRKPSASASRKLLRKIMREHYSADQDDNSDGFAALQCPRALENRIPFGLLDANKKACRPVPVGPAKQKWRVAGEGSSRQAETGSPEVLRRVVNQDQLDRYLDVLHTQKSQDRERAKDRSRRPGGTAMKSTKKDLPSVSSAKCAIVSTAEEALRKCFKLNAQSDAIDHTFDEESSDGGDRRMEDSS